MLTRLGTWRRWAIVALVAGLLPLTTYGQSINATLSGVVTDPSGAVVPGATATLTSVARATALTATTNEVGQYSFPNLPQGSYEFKVSAKGFREFIQRGISLNSSQLARVDVLLELGQSAQAVEVMANASPLNYENAKIKQAVTANQVASLPLIVSGKMRSVMAFIVILPGVNMGSNASYTNARLNGNLGTGGDESTLDGVTMQEGLLNQGGLISFSDMPMPPETVEEVSLLTSNYEPQYGKTTGAVINISTKTGTDSFHGHVYEYARNTVFNARQWNVAKKPKNIENDLGGGIGGPVKLPLAWSGNRKTYFFVHWSGYRSRGSTTIPTYTVPTEKMWNGDFSEWPNPIYDPATTAPIDPNLPLSSSNLTRTQFMGCDPVNNPQPNVICPARFAGTLPTEWMTVASQVLKPTKPGVTQNFTGTGRAGSWSNLDRWDMRFDHEIGTSDRISVTEHSGKIHASTESDFPAQLTAGNTRVGDHFRTPRVNWDHTFSPNLLTHTAFGYLNWNTTTFNYSDAYVGLVPGIAGVYSHVNQPALNFTDYNGWGGNEGISTNRPDYVWNNMTTWVHGKHTFKIGGEYRNFSYPETVTREAPGTLPLRSLRPAFRG